MRESLDRYFLRGCFADTTVIADPGSGGSSFAVDDAGAAGVFPYSKMAWGSSGTQTAVSSGASAVPVQDGGNSLTVDGTVTAAQATAANLNCTEASAAAIKTSVEIMDDWDESDRAKVNIIVGQAGVAAGNGTSGVTVPRVTIASDSTGQVAINQSKTLKTASGTLSSDTDVIAAVSSKRLKVYAMNIFTVGTNANAAIFKSNGTSGTELWRFLIQGASGSPMGLTLAVTPPAFLFATVAGEKLTLDVGNADTLHYSLAYWDDDAT